MNKIKSFLIAMLTLCFAPTVLAQRIVVSHDVNTLSSSVAGTQEAEFAVNVASWLSQGNGTNVLMVFSNPNFPGYDYAPTVQSALANAGFNVTTSWADNWTVATLSAFDAVFVALRYPDLNDASSITTIDQQELISYINAGGGVYLAGGAQNLVDEVIWQPFLNEFGFNFTTVNGISPSVPVNNAHPIFDGISSLGCEFGNSIVDLEPTDESNQVLVTFNDQGVYAVFDGSSIAPEPSSGSYFGLLTLGFVFCSKPLIRSAKNTVHSYKKRQDEGIILDRGDR